MQSGQVFRVDTQATQEMADFYKREVRAFEDLDGLEFSIAKSKATPAVTSTEVRASKWVDGKPKKGRPRKFPRATVARLLGLTDDPSLTGETPQGNSTEDSSGDDNASEDLREAAADAIEAETANVTNSDDSVDNEEW